MLRSFGHNVLFSDEVVSARTRALHLRWSSLCSSDFAGKSDCERGRTAPHQTSGGQREWTIMYQRDHNTASTRYLNIFSMVTYLFVSAIQQCALLLLLSTMEFHGIGVERALCFA